MLVQIISKRKHFVFPAMFFLGVGGYLGGLCCHGFSTDFGSYYESQKSYIT